MKNLFLASLLLISGTTITINAAETYTHYCTCGKPPVNESGIDCNKACSTKKGGGWTGQAIISNTKDLKGIKCKCNNVEKGERVYVEYPCQRTGMKFGKCPVFTDWTNVVHSAKSNKDITVEQGKEKLDRGDGIVADL